MKSRCASRVRSSDAGCTGVDDGDSRTTLMGLAWHAQTVNTAGRDLTQLFSRIWQVTNAPSKPASGSIYIFLANGTLLETSCVETYRIATWTIDKTGAVGVACCRR